MKVYGYIRISSAKQRIDRQMMDLQAHGVPENAIFIDKKSGRDFDRPSYQALIKTLQCGDLLYIKSIDRLGRSSEEVQEQWKILTQEKGVDIAVIDTPCLDTRIKNDFLCEFINHMLLYIMSFLAENERIVTQKRQSEGIKAAKKRGVHFGRTRKPLPENFKECCILYLSHKLTVREAAELCGMAKSTFADAVKRAMTEGQIQITENQSNNNEIDVSKKQPIVPEKELEISKKCEEKTGPKLFGWEKNWTEILTFAQKTNRSPFYGIQMINQSVSKSRKNPLKRKKSGRKQTAFCPVKYTHSYKLSGKFF